MRQPLVVLLIGAFGIPAGLLGALGGALIGNAWAGLALAILMSAAVAWRVSLESGVEPWVRGTAIALGVAGATFCFIVGAAALYD